MTRRNGGFALILVIWALVLLASVATGFAFAVRHEARAAGDLAAQARAEAIGAAAIRHAALALSSTDRTLAWQADAQVRTLPWPEARVHVRVRAESALIDLNRAPPAFLTGLFEQLLPEADAAALTDAVVDWRDRDDRPLPHGAEDDDYRRAGFAYGPSNRPFQSVNELSQVMGFGYTDLEAVTPYLTVHSRWARVSAASADPVVLAALPGIDRAAAEAFVARRDAAHAAGDTPDYGPLEGGGRHVETRAGNNTFALEIEVRLDDGTLWRERVVIRLDPARGFSMLARTPLAATAPEGGAAL